MFTPEEMKVLVLLTEAWNVFNTLPKMHLKDIDRFGASISDCQRLIAIRESRREHPDMFHSLDDENNDK